MLLLQKCYQQSFEDIEVKNKELITLKYIWSFCLVELTEEVGGISFFFLIVNHLKYEEKYAIPKRVFMRNIYLTKKKIEQYNVINR